MIMVYHNEIYYSKNLYIKEVEEKEQKMQIDSTNLEQFVRIHLLRQIEEMNLKTTIKDKLSNTY